MGAQIADFVIGRTEAPQKLVFGVDIVIWGVVFMAHIDWEIGSRRGNDRAIK